MNRLLILALAAGLLSPIKAKGEGLPIPQVSDKQLKISYPIKINFKCPQKNVLKDNNDGGAKEWQRENIYEKCWLDLHKDHIHIMNRQKIFKKDITKSWKVYNWYKSRNAGQEYVADWNFLYKTDNGSEYIFTLSKGKIQDYYKGDKLRIFRSPTKHFIDVTKIMNSWLAN